MIDEDLPQIDLDALTEETTIAYLFGGIVAAGQGVVTFPETFASNQLFQIVFEPGPGCPADLDQNGVVESADLGLLLLAWGRVPDGTPADINADRVVNSSDLGALIASWGPCID